MHLVEEHSVVDPTYIEDFLLTYRTFLSSPMVVGKKLLEWFHDSSLRDKVWAAGLCNTPIVDIESQSILIYRILIKNVLIYFKIIQVMQRASNPNQMEDYMLQSDTTECLSTLMPICHNTCLTYTLFL